MEDPTRATASGGSRQHHGGDGEQPVRSRWTPKPEQILILETIFNSGMVNPPKDETVRIRKLLEKFGSVADANVFYWFQNRRSRSRRHQRQVQATLAGDHPRPPAADNNTLAAAASTNFVPNSLSHCINSPSYAGPGSSSSSSFGLDSNSNNNPIGIFGLSAYPGQMQEFEQNPIFCSSPPIQSEMMTVMMNGVATEVGRGPVDIKSIYGGDYVVFDSSGVAVEMNEFGIVVQGLQHGQSYFLVPTHACWSLKK